MGRGTSGCTRPGASGSRNSGGGRIGEAIRGGVPILLPFLKQEGAAPLSGRDDPTAQAVLRGYLALALARCAPADLRLQRALREALDTETDPGARDCLEQAIARSGGGR